MPFNSDTYHANKQRRTAWQTLAEARAIKARADRGEAYDWEVETISRRVKSARLAMRLHLMFRRFGAMKKG